PGALTNQPAAADAEQAIDTVGALADDSAGQTRWTRNFELDKSISHTRVPVGRLRRLSVAVVIDDAITVNADGTKDRKPYSEEEIGRLTQLVKDAVGFDADRGDAVNVFNSAFQDSEVLPPVPWWQQGWMLSVGKLAVGGLLVLMVLLMVVRPLIKALTRSLEVKEKKPRTGPALLDTGANEGPEAIGQMDFDTLSLSGGEDTMPDLDIAPNYQADIRLARRVAASDPRRAAHVVKKWLEDGR
ncbi:MAG: hypothetical protein HOI95_19570, partial [Chromatiales bacterium]|nr:hypothetical protein [Chromatiales bacterium]